MPPRPRRIKPTTGAGPDPPRADRIKKLPKDKSKKKKKKRPGEGGVTLFNTIAAAAAAAVVALAARAITSSLAFSRRSTDALQRAASKPLRFTDHARERMQCRHVTERQVREALKIGKVVRKKSEVGGLSGSRMTGASFGGVCDKLVVNAEIPPGRRSSSGRRRRRSGSGSGSGSGDDEEGEEEAEEDSSMEPHKSLQAVFKACPLDTSVITVIDRAVDWPGCEK